MDRKKNKAIIKEWIVRMNTMETLPENIIALNFGLYEPYGIELIGSSQYDEEDDDWACEEDFVPEERTCQLFIRKGWDENKLQRIYGSGRQADRSNDS